VFTNMLHTAELDMAKSVNASDIGILLAGAVWAICFYPPYSIKSLTRYSDIWTRYAL
jgi:hypothetical protein